MPLTHAFQKEVLDLQTQILCLGNQVKKQALNIKDIGDYIPGSVMIQNINNMTNTYMNKNGCDILHRSSEELSMLGPDYFRLFFPPEEVLSNKNDLIQFIGEDDTTKLHSFLQRVRPDARSEYKWFFTTSRIVKSPENPFLTSLIHISVSVNTLNLTGYRISSMIENDEYIRKNFQRFNLLSVREKEVIKMIVEGKSSYEIATTLFRSIHTINTHRKNIIHKLEVHSLAGLIKFAVAFNLV